MEQHPLPRQITTFEFKLIGFMTLRQFIYLLIFLPLGYIAYKIIPIPLVNIFLALIIGSIGPIVAFVPFNDRPIDLLLKNLFRSLTSPTQYFYQKDNSALYFLNNLYFVSDPHQTMSHVESQEKLATYLAKTGPQDSQDAHEHAKKQSIQELFSSPQAGAGEPLLRASSPLPDGLTAPEPFVTGVVKNNKQTPLPGVLIYIRDQNQKPLRLLKTNPHGVFATYNSLPPGDYTFEVKDPKGAFFFDTMKLHLEQTGGTPLEFVSKELL